MSENFSPQINQSMGAAVFGSTTSNAKSTLEKQQNNSNSNNNNNNTSNNTPVQGFVGSSNANTTVSRDELRKLMKEAIDVEADLARVQSKTESLKQVLPGLLSLLRGKQIGNAYLPGILERVQSVSAKIQTLPPDLRRDFDKEWLDLQQAEKDLPTCLSSCTQYFTLGLEYGGNNPHNGSTVTGLMQGAGLNGSSHDHTGAVAKAQANTPSNLTLPQQAAAPSSFSVPESLLPQGQQPMAPLNHPQQAAAPGNTVSLVPPPRPPSQGLQPMGPLQPKRSTATQLAFIPSTPGHQPSLQPPLASNPQSVWSTTKPSAFTPSGHGRQPVMPRPNASNQAATFHTPNLHKSSVDGSHCNQNSAKRTPSTDGFNFSVAAAGNATPHIPNQTTTNTLASTSTVGLSAGPACSNTRSIPNQSAANGPPVFGSAAGGSSTGSGGLSFAPETFGGNQSNANSSDINAPPTFASAVGGSSNDSGGLTFAPATFAYNQFNANQSTAGGANFNLAAASAGMVGGHAGNNRAPVDSSACNGGTPTASSASTFVGTNKFFSNGASNAVNGYIGPNGFHFTPTTSRAGTNQSTAIGASNAGAGAGSIVPGGIEFNTAAAGNGRGTDGDQRMNVFKAEYESITSAAIAFPGTQYAKASPAVCLAHAYHATKMNRLTANVEIVDIEKLRSMKATSFRHMTTLLKNGGFNDNEAHKANFCLATRMGFVAVGSSSTFVGKVWKMNYFNEFVARSFPAMYNQKALPEEHIWCADQLAVEKAAEKTAEEAK